MRKEEYSKEAQRTITIIEEKYNIDWDDKKALEDLTIIDLGHSIPQEPLVKKIHNEFFLELVKLKWSYVPLQLTLKDFQYQYNTFIKDFFLTKLKHQFDELETFFLLRNKGKIKDISPLRELKKLVKLYLNDNRISDISPLSNLTSLTYLDLHNNHQVYNLSILSNLKNLEILDLNDNSLENIEVLEKFKNLSFLILNSTQTCDISILQNLTKLEHLRLNHNTITDVSGLEKLTKLLTLDLRYNKIKNISPLSNLKNLEALDLGGNSISKIPKNLFYLEVKLGKKWIMSGMILDDNPIQEPPLEIIKQGNQAIQKYFDDLEAQGRGKLNEAKLIIVGEPEAGKSSLMECLLNPKYKLEDSKESTMGIDVKPWKFALPEQNERKMRANIWDFGGQQIQYMTHQFFLTPDSLYVLVTANDRKSSSNFPYWFKIIHLLGEIDGRYSPVLVVKNKKSDQFHFDFDEAYYRRLYPNLQIEVREVDLGNRQGDFVALQEKIQEMITKLPLVNDDRPAKWSLIRQDLEKLEKNHICFDEYAKVCATHDVTDIESQKLLSSYLHSIGSLLHFIEDISLRDFIILNPQWAVDAVYSVLSDTSVAQNQGEFDQKLLDRVWQEYSISEQVNLLSLMKKDNFEICYPLNHQTNTYITPQLLPNTRPTYEFDTKQSLKFRFRYKFMPDGIISRLIVRLSEYIDDSLVWKKGVVLQDNGTKAQVIEEDNRDGLKIIDIHVSGEEQKRKYLLHTIRKEIDAIHKKWFKNIESEEMIPCGCSECMESEKPYYYEYSTLMKYQQKSKLTIECRESIEDVSVLLLIEGVEPPKEIIKEQEKRIVYTENYYEQNSSGSGDNVGKDKKEDRSTHIGRDNNGVVNNGNENDIDQENKSKG